MAWFGALLGGAVGFMLGGPLGAIGGAALGHFFMDRGSQRGDTRGYSSYSSPFLRQGGGYGQAATVERVQASYFVAVFSIFGKIAKADGVVTKQEGEMVRRFVDQMGIRGEQREFALRVFNEARNSSYSVRELATQFYQLTYGRREIHTNFIDMLYQIAGADGVIHPREEELIREVAATIHVTADIMEAIRARYGDTIDADYTLLGISPDSSDAEVRSAYRRLAAEHHPDRIIAKGMPEEFVAFATKRFQAIQGAYEHIAHARKL